MLMGNVKCFLNEKDLYELDMKNLQDIEGTELYREYVTLWYRERN